jgi:hypothetical protein
LYAGEGLGRFNVKDIIESAVVEDRKVRFNAASPGKRYNVPPSLMVVTDSGGPCFCAGNWMKFGGLALNVDQLQDASYVFCCLCMCPQSR